MRTPPDLFSTSELAPRNPNDPARIGRYRVVGRIGTGGTGTVYAALDEVNAPIAVKVVHREYAADEDFRARFAREADLIQRVRSRCVPLFHGADPGAEPPWLATEYVAGLTLRRHVHSHGPLDLPMLLALGAGIAEALEAVHAAGIVHRGLKPGNVILAPDSPKVLDSGIARAVDETALIRTGGLVGTPGWISPEQYRGEPVTDRSDMFLWGGLLGFAATGRDPFGQGAPNVLAYRVMQDPPDLIGLPGLLRPLVLAAMAKNPAERPTASQARAAIAALWTQLRNPHTVHPGQAPGNGDVVTAEWARASARLPARPKRPRKAGRGLIVGAAATALVLAGSALTATALLDSPSEQAGNEAPPGPSDEPIIRPTDKEELLQAVSRALDDSTSADWRLQSYEGGDAASVSFGRLSCDGDGTGVYLHDTESDFSAVPTFVPGEEPEPAFRQYESESGGGLATDEGLYSADRSQFWEIDAEIPREYWMNAMDSESISCSQVTGSISSSETLRIVGEEEINGVSTTHWAGTTRLEGLADNTVGWARSGYEDFLETGIELGEINFDLWVDQQNRPVILYQENPSHETGLQSRWFALTLTDWDESDEVIEVD